MGKLSDEEKLGVKAGIAEETTKGLTEEQKAAVVASFNEGVAKKTN